MEETKFITISREEYDAIMDARSTLNKICRMIETQGYEVDQVIADILQLRPQAVDNEARHG